MNQPLVPLFLPRQASDQSQPTGWRTAARAARVARVARPARVAGQSDPEQSVPARHPSDDRPGPAARSRAVWAVVITGLALFMASLDNLVVSTALPVIRVHLHAGLSGLEWTVNAYTLTFAVLLLSAAALGER